MIGEFFTWMVVTDHVNDNTSTGMVIMSPTTPTLMSPTPQTAIVVTTGGITCEAIDEPRKSSKAIDKHVIINFRDKNVVIARFCDKNEVLVLFIDIYIH